jgi:hypothetical protein
MAISQIPGVGPRNADVANAVAAAIPTAGNIQNIVTNFANLPSGMPNWTLQQTITSSSNNISVPNATVYAVVASGGTGAFHWGDPPSDNNRLGGTGGTVVFGVTPSSTRAVVAAAGQGSSSSYGNLVASPPNLYVFPSASSNVISAVELIQFPNGVSGPFGGLGGNPNNAGASLATGGGGVGGYTQAGVTARAGGNSTFGYTGGAAGPANNNSYGAGGGGGAGIAGNGGAGGAGGANQDGAGGNGGIGGGGGGAPGKNGYNNQWTYTTPFGTANGGQGAILLYY